MIQKVTKFKSMFVTVQKKVHSLLTNSLEECVTICNMLRRRHILLRTAFLEGPFKKSNEGM